MKMDRDKVSGHRSATRISFKSVALAAYVAVPIILVGCVWLMAYFGWSNQPEFECLTNDHVADLLTAEGDGADIHVVSPGEGN